MDDIKYPFGWTFVAIMLYTIEYPLLYRPKTTKNTENVTKIFLNPLTTADLIFCAFRVVPAIHTSSTGRIL